MEEIWKDIEGYEGKYQVSNLGKIINKNKNIQCKPFKNNSGYMYVKLNRKNEAVHRIVAANFLENKNNLPVVNHKDFNRTNNNVLNLEWCDYKYNNLYSAFKKYKKIAQYDLEGNLIAIYKSIKEASEKLKLDNSTIIKVIKGKRKHTGGFKFKYI